MNTKRRWQVIGMGVLILTLAVGVSVYTNRMPTSTAPATQETAEGTILFTIEGLYKDKQVSIASGDTVLLVLQTLNAQDPKLRLSTKEYSGLGVLVDGMYGQKNGTDNKYWQYNVNGIMPQIGAGQLKLNNSDSVEWFFGPSEL